MNFKLLRGFVDSHSRPIRWRNAAGINVPLRQISTDHIRNIMNCLAGVGNMRIPNPYEGKSRNEWYIIFHHELLRRRNA